MSDPQAVPDDQREVDAIGVDPDIVTNDRDPEPDELAPTPGTEKDDDEDHDEVDVADLP